jgi:SHS2 domain-containing protein
MGYNKNALIIGDNGSTMKKLSAGFREIEHTADWEMQVWAPDLPGLLEQAALGMYALAGAHVAGKPRIKRIVQLSAQDEESLLVSFLEELRYIGEMEGLAFDVFQIMVQGYRLDAELTGSALLSVDKEIKAVTFHNLTVRKTEHGIEASVVFDV